jgi:hypothetical protein
MADWATIMAEINGLPANLRPTFTRIFQGLLGDLRIGHPTFAARDPLKNFSGAFIHTTTHATPNTEFSIVHGFERIPYLLLPVLPLDTVGAQIVPLVVTRAVDDKRMYLSSSVASAPVTFAVEG